MEQLTQCLRYACVSGNVAVVHLLIQRGADPIGCDDSSKAFPLSNAVRHGHADIVKELLAAGADVAQPVWDENELGEIRGTTSTLVDLAIRHGYPQIAKLVG
jgi:ankyrin repeat protein